MLLDSTLNQYLEKTILKGSHWVFKALLFIVPLAIFINFGFDLKRWAFIKNFIILVTGGQLNPQLCCYYWSDIAYQTTDLLMERIQVWDFVHQANMRFRLVLPALWMVFHSAAMIYLIQVLLGIAQLYMTLRIVYAITQDKVTAFYFTLGFAGLYSGAAFYLDFYGFGDAFAFIFMTAALFFRKPGLIFLAVILAALVDERALFNTSFIVLFHGLIANKDTPDRVILKILRINSPVIAIVSAGIVYLVVRWYLTQHFHLKTPYGGPSPFFYVREAVKFFGIRLWTGFESFWILILLALFVLYYQRSYQFLVLLLCFVGLTVFTFLLQGDHTRTAAFAFPLLFVAAVIVQAPLSRVELRSVLLIISLIALVFFPIYY